MVAEAVERLAAGNQVLRLSSCLMLVERERFLRERILEILSPAPTGKEMAGSGSYPSLPAETLRTRLLHHCDRSAFHDFLERMVAEGMVLRQGEQICLPQAVHRQADPQLESLSRRLLAELEGRLVVELEELAEKTASKRAQVEKCIVQMSERTEAEIVAYDFAAGCSSLERAHQVLQELWEERGDISPGEFRARLGTTRKYAMALLAHFDDRKVTRRTEKGRVLLTPLSQRQLS